MAFNIPPISRNDEDILNAIFNPDSGLSLDGHRPEDDTPHSTPIDAKLLDQLKQLEQEAVVLAEKDAVDASLEKLNECIRLEPTYASAYNNRAQAYRLKGDTTKALDDLKLAIEHGAGNPPILKQAYTQRAIVRKELGDEAGSESDFAQGARYGNEIAKAAVKNNPYAKMCNAIVMEAMTKLGASHS
ncbi:hypothetical protein PhCBS80983_g05834 [Powellomyces hirtus]|uniref:Uncharacterized protein n=1 Tax=Powellomyces hirtus TaxID=109895 RepID=A0A507DTY6_9FUNG|nr:hypothetical protein PhCBS80983_g05834 [Powellomyces hirtus]